MIGRTAPPDARLMTVLIVVAIAVGIIVGYWIYSSL